MVTGIQELIMVEQSFGRTSTVFHLNIMINTNTISSEN
jgi:hypothetical protein